MEKIIFSCFIIISLISRGTFAQTILVEPSIVCKGQTAVFYVSGGTENYDWDFGGTGTKSDTRNPNHVFPTAGTFTVSCTDGSNTYSKVIEVVDCQKDIACANCLTQFSPTKGKKYAISAWASQTNADEVNNFTWPQIIISTGPFGKDTFETSGAVIDGWQRIYGEFFLDASIEELEIELFCNDIPHSSSNFVFFDDIRIHPFDGNMKSYVYDPITLKLVAELDNNNYSTFYEYDEEGKLIRVKKETERGIATIKENRNNSFKVD